MAISSLDDASKSGRVSIRMKRQNWFVRFWVLCGLMLLLTSGSVQAAEKTQYKPQGYVSDFAGMISPEARQEITLLAEELEQQQQVQMAIVTVPSVGDRAVEDFATDLFAQWGIGQKSSDKGVLLLVAKQEHKTRVEVGYGLEDKIPDAIAKEISEAVSQRFRTGDFDGGFVSGAQMISAAVGGTLQLPKRRSRGQSGGGPNIGSLAFIFFLIIFGILRGIFRMATGRRVVRHGSSIPWWLLLLMSGRGGGSSWSGGGFSGGGGGFGGFGGGMSGGGGATSSW